MDRTSVFGGLAARDRIERRRAETERLGVREPLLGAPADDLDHPRAPRDRELVEPVLAADDEGALDRPLWPVLRSAAALLTSDDIARIRECAAERCAWLFIDHSRNRSRRWCDMRDCGNRAKARRHYARAKARALAEQFDVTGGDIRNAVLKAALGAASSAGHDTGKMIHQHHLEEGIKDVIAGKRVMQRAEIRVRVVLNRGASGATVWTCDLSHDYVSINADYRS